MIQNKYYTQENHGPIEFFNIGNLELEEGGVIRDCTLAYATFGELNSTKSNAVLIPTWFSGTSKIMEQVYIGEDRALDPSKYFIIIVNQIGNGLSTSPHNCPLPSGQGYFPKVRVGDDVKAQHKFIKEKFGLTELVLVVGASMGAQQTYEWAVRFPTMVKRAAPIAGTAKNTLHDFVYAQTLADALTSDPAWNNGFYKSSEEMHVGLKRHAMLWTVMGWSTEFFAKERYLDLGFPSLDDFIINFMHNYFLPMDPNNLLCMISKWQHGDVSKNTHGNLTEALGRIKAKTFVMPISHDMFFPPSDCHKEQLLIPDSELRIIDTIDGHLGLFGTDPEFIIQIDTHLRDLLSVNVDIDKFAAT